MSTPTYPSFEDVRRAVAWNRTPDTGRIIWDFDAPWPQCITVMKERFHPNVIEPYFDNGKWHQVAQASVTEPKVSSITVKVLQLGYWERDWIELHREDIESKWGDLSDYDPATDSDKEEHLLSCCGEQRPRKKNVSMTVRPASGQFVTIHDYLLTLHPWLLSLKEDILKAMAVSETHSSGDLVVSFGGIHMLSIEDKARWANTTAVAQPSLNTHWIPSGAVHSLPGPSSVTEFIQLAKGLTPPVRGMAPVPVEDESMTTGPVFGPQDYQGESGSQSK